MTLVLMKMQESRPELREKSHSPAAITADVTRRFIPRRWLTTSVRADLTMFSHFLFGATTGALFGVMTPKVSRATTARHPPAPPWGRGVLFGLGVWAASYLGWVPVLGLRPAATKVSSARNAQMILAHVAWGAALALAYDELRRDGEKHWAGDRRV